MSAVSELNRNINYFSDAFHKIEKITAGTKVLTKTGTASASHIAFTNADIDNLLGVTNTSNANTVIFIMNGDGKANAVHFTTTYQSGNWYAVGESSWTGNLRVNYIIIRFI